MPTIPLEEFDNPPDIGDKVKVTGRVERIDEDTDEVYISYDKVEMVSEDDDKKDKKKKKRTYNKNDYNPPDEITVDEALSESFPMQPAPMGPGAIQG